MAGTGTAHLRPDKGPILTVNDLVVEFPAVGGGRVHAVSGVSFDVLEGETLGLVGESGCGKSTTGRAIMQLPKPTSGSVLFAGTELTGLARRELRRTRTQMQMIFQDPVSSLNPRRKVRDIVAEGPEIWRRKIAGSPVIDEILEAVGLDPVVVADRWPHELSGGQCQRVCIARALILDPKLLICDESVSALDVSVQAQILNLLEDMKARYRLTMIFVSHDLGVIKNISDRVVVMYLGKVCEVASSDTLYASPAHPYTRLLLESIPSTTPVPADAAAAAEADQPSAVDPPSGCRFRTRCPKAAERCAIEEPQIAAVAPGHYVACHFPELTRDAGGSLMLRTVGVKAALLIPVLFLVTLGTFFMVDLVPGDPAANVLGPNGTPQDYARVNQELGFNRPLLSRYFHWLGSALHGNLGSNLVPPIERVSTILARAFPVNIELAVLALLMAFAIAIPVGIWSAYRPGSRFDRILSAGAFGSISVPSFLGGIILIMVLAINWRFFPLGQWARPTARGWLTNLHYAFLPALTLAIPEAAVFTRLLRSDMIGTLQEDYILAARAKGMPTAHILVREALRPSSFSLITLAGLSVGRLIGGTVIVEQVFSLPGVGQAVITAARHNDYTVVQGGVLVIAIIYVGVNLVVDVLYAYLDPRIRRGRL